MTWRVHARYQFSRSRRVDLVRGDDSIAYVHEPLLGAASIVVAFNHRDTDHAYTLAHDLARELAPRTTLIGNSVLVSGDDRHAVVNNYFGGLL